MVLAVLTGLALVFVLGASIVYQGKMVFAGLGLAGLVLVCLIPRRLVSPTAIGVVLALALAVSAPTAPETGWMTTTGVAALLALVGLVRGARDERASWSSWALLTAFFLFLGASTFLEAPENLGKWLFAATVPILVAALGTRLDGAGVRLLAAVIVTLAVIEALSGIAQLTVMHQPLWGYPVSSSGQPIVQLNPLLGDRVPRAQGTVGHPIVFGFVLAVAIVIAWADLGRIRAALRWPAIATIGAGLVLSGSRSAVAAAVLGVVVVLFSGRDVGRKVRAVFVLAFMAAGALVLSVSISEAAARVSVTGSYTHRLGAVDSIANLLGRPAVESLIGSGFGSERSLFQRGLLQGDGFFAIDNEIVTVIATAGILGLILFVGFCVGSIVLAAPRLRGVPLTTFVMFFSFDVTSWVLGSTVLALVAALVLRRSPVLATADKHEVEPHRAPATIGRP